MLNKLLIDNVKLLAEEHGYQAAKLLAVIDVESAGVAFWSIGTKSLSPIRFEGHYFYRKLTGSKLEQAVKTGLASPKAGGVKNPSNFADRYELLERAKAIDTVAALESTSFGLGQIMGDHWESLGFESIQEFVKANETLRGQIELIIKFIEINDLKDEIDNEQWATFAKAYNGPNYKKNAYDKKLKAAYIKYSSSVDTIEADEIAQLQKMLNTIYPEYKLTIDGKNGPATKAALRDFQLKNGLKVDGVYGPLSRETIQKKYIEVSDAKVTNAGVVGTAVSTVATGITKAAETIAPFAKTSQIIQFIFVGLLVVSVLVMLKPYFFPKKVV
jgi:hypothetical protein